MKLRSPNPGVGKEGWVSEKSVVLLFSKGIFIPFLPFPFASKSGVEGKVRSDRNYVIYLFIFHPHYGDELICIFIGN